jgi:hypothetical protein
MRTLGVTLLALGLGAGFSLQSAPANAKGKSRGQGSDGAAPAANAEEINKLKAVRLGDPKAGTFKWNMTPEDVMAQVKASINKKYQPRIEGSAQDPGKQQRIRDEQEKEINAVKKSFTRFEGQKTGWDVSIIGPEFEQNTGEAVIVAKEDIWTRYFFFFENGLYKMFLAFNKDAIGGKTFREFGKGMEGKYGRSKEVYRDEKVQAGMKHILDHYEWSAGPDKLKLVDRSEFYGVYCMVLVDAKTQERENEKRKITNPEQSTHDSLVEAVTTKDTNDRDANDNIIDRITGKEVKKPGEEQKHADIVVPSQHGKTSSSSASSADTAAAPGPQKETKETKKKGKKSDNPMDGLEL